MPRVNPEGLSRSDFSKVEPSGRGNDMNFVSMVGEVQRLCLDEMPCGIVGGLRIRRGEDRNAQSASAIGELCPAVDFGAPRKGAVFPSAKRLARESTRASGSTGFVTGRGPRRHAGHDAKYWIVIVYERPIRFDEVDPAGIVFFARFMNYAHEAMENFFAGLAGGYPALIQERRVGLPTVHLESDFRVPLRYGETLRIETACAKLGNTSATLVHEMKNAKSGDLCAVVRHVVVTVTLGVLTPCPMPSDVRDVFGAHLLRD